MCVLINLLVGHNLLQEGNPLGREDDVGSVTAAMLAQTLDLAQTARI